jgi:hypothetical protein
MEMSGKIHTPAALTLAKSSSAHSIEGCLPPGYLNFEQQREISLPASNYSRKNPDRSPVTKPTAFPPLNK